MKWFGMAAVILTVVVVALGASPMVQAQPVASISLPPPGAAKDLYAGCNNIALTFPDGTGSQTVVQAVTVPGAVESLWRHSAALNKFEGFSPAAPQASDLLSVNFLDPVWVCMSSSSGGTSSAPPPSAGDLAVTDIFPDNLPSGRLHATITNHGPVVIMTLQTDVTCNAHGTRWGGPPAPVDLSNSQKVILQLNPGQAEDVDTGIDIDANLYQYEVTCTIPVEAFDPNPANNTYSETIPP